MFGYHVLHTIKLCVVHAMREHKLKTPSPPTAVASSSLENTKKNERGLASCLVARARPWSSRRHRGARVGRENREMGYDDPPPWVFRGKALYQLALVRVDDAKAHVPNDLPLVNFFGWTLGGLYAARYDESPCGKLDEIVVLGGLCWNPPTSCAWATRVYVDSKDAREHGIRTCGLPSRAVEFRENEHAGDKGKSRGWWRSKKRDENLASVSVIEDKKKVCDLRFPNEPKVKGPRISMFLPSFSGKTKSIPDLLKYSLRMRANIRLSSPIKVETPVETKGVADRGTLSTVLTAKPLLCIAFDNMHMDVGAPQKVVISKSSK